MKKKRIMPSGSSPVYREAWRRKAGVHRKSSRKDKRLISIEREALS